jgi:hypothetical protein
LNARRFRGNPPTTVISISLAIGPLTFVLDGPALADVGLAVAIRTRYARFLVGDDEGPARTMRLTLSLAPEGAPKPDDVPRIGRLGARAFSVDYGALQAELDLEGGVGRATVLPTVYIVDSLLRIVTTLVALERDALLVHGSGVWLPGRSRVLVSFGPSGVGKTTVARSVAPADVLCDEMMLLHASDDGRVFASGTPFHGDLPIVAPGTGEAAALVRLRHGPPSSPPVLSPLGAAASAKELLGSVLFFSRDEDLADRLLGLALRIATGRTYTLVFPRETHVPRTIDDHLRQHTPPAGEGAPR